MKRIIAIISVLVLSFLFGMSAVAEKTTEKNTKEWVSLGEQYFTGDGVDKNIKEAIRYFSLAAKEGDGWAEYRLGQCYENGLGVTKSSEEAYRYYYLAAQKGEEKAQAKVGYYNYNGIACEKNLTMAVKYFRLAAEQGNASAQYNLGLCYLNGKGVKKNSEKAVDYFHMSADQGNKSAQYQLGKCYKNGIGIEKNDVEANKYLQLAADQGHEEAKKELAASYESSVTLINGIHLGDSEEIFLSKVSEATKREKDNSYYVSVPMGKEKLRAFIFFQDSHVSDVVYVIDNTHDIMHIIRKKENGVDEKYKGADSYEEFNVLYQSIKDSLMEKYGEPLIDDDPTVTYAISTRAPEWYKDEKVLNRSEWVFRDGMKYIKIELINSYRPNSNSSVFYSGQIITGYTAFSEDDLQRIINEIEEEKRKEENTEKEMQDVITGIF